jgi:hypothetical protein
MEDERGGARSTPGRSRQSFDGKTLSGRTPRKKCAETTERKEAMCHRVAPGMSL